MWDTVSVIAAVVVIILLFEILDITEALKDRIRGRMSRKNLEDRITQLEKRVDDLCNKQ
jgi:beta-lactamase regulating signal transducer with metallopeptidase domain